VKAGGLLSETFGQGASGLQQAFGEQTSGLGTAMALPAAAIPAETARGMAGEWDRQVSA